MKNILASLLCLMTLASVSEAHPEDSDSFVALGANSKIVLKQPINIKPNTPAAFIDTSGPEQLILQCVFDVGDTSEFDRVLTGTLTVVAANPAGNWLKLRTQSGRSTVSLQCLQSFNYDNANKYMTIGNLKKYFSDTFEVIIASPRPIE